MAPKLNVWSADLYRTLAAWLLIWGANVDSLRSSEVSSLVRIAENETAILSDINGPCLISKDCMTSSAECLNGACHCIYPKNYHDKQRNSCISAPYPHLYEECFRESECVSAYTICRAPYSGARITRCVCMDGYTAVPDLDVCEAIGTPVADSTYSIRLGSSAALLVLFIVACVIAICACRSKTTNLRRYSSRHESIAMSGPDHASSDVFTIPVHRQRSFLFLDKPPSYEEALQYAQILLAQEPPRLQQSSQNPPAGAESLDPNVATCSSNVQEPTREPSTSSSSPSPNPRDQSSVPHQPLQNSSLPADRLV